MIGEIPAVKYLIGQPGAAGQQHYPSGSYRASTSISKINERRGRSNRQPDRRLEAAQHAFFQQDIAAMAARDVARDGQPETRIPLVLIARMIQPVKGSEHIAPLRRRNARPDRKSVV